jgi:hypothetical protein
MLARRELERQKNRREANGATGTVMEEGRWRALQRGALALPMPIRQAGE